MQKGDWFGIAIVTVLLIGVGAFFAYAPKASKVVYAPTEIAGSTLTAKAEAGERAVQVAAEVVQAGFVTVHQAIGDAPGPIVGQSPLLAIGTHSEVIIETTEVLNPPGDYFVLLFVDDGDNVFEEGIDLPVMSEGQVVKQKISL